MLKKYLFSFVVIGLLMVGMPSYAATSVDINWQWPALGEITAKFHDGSYAFNQYFQHSGLDIAINQSTPVIAAAKGTVIMVQKPKKDKYSFVMLKHKDNYTTLYGHLSDIDVKPGDKVNAGDIIGLSGGEPGTKGAGEYSTGPHLHFELRDMGVPVNPKKFLPEL